jgi:hypothetical protein
MLDGSRGLASSTALYCTALYAAISDDPLFLQALQLFGCALATASAELSLLIQQSASPSGGIARGQSGVLVKI